MIILSLSMGMIFFKVSYVDCSSIIISDYLNIDAVLSLDKGFKLFSEINLFELS